MFARWCYGACSLRCWCSAVWVVAEVLFDAGLGAAAGAGRGAVVGAVQGAGQGAVWCAQGGGWRCLLGWSAGGCWSRSFVLGRCLRAPFVLYRA